MEDFEVGSYHARTNWATVELAAYRFRERTTISGAMLYGSGLRTAASGAAFTNSSHFQLWTPYNALITHVLTLP